MNTEKVERLIKIISSISIPLIIAVFGWLIQNRISNQNLSKEFVGISISILSDSTVDKSIRSWAVDNLQHYSKIPLDSNAVHDLKSGSLLVANLSFYKGDYMSSKNHLKRVLKGDPMNSDLRAKLGYAYYNLGMYDSALLEFDKATKVFPGYGRYFYHKAIVYEKMGRIKDALGNSEKSKVLFELSINELNKSLELNEGIHESYNNRGWLKIQLGDTTGACKDFSTAKKLGNTIADTNIRRYCGGSILHNASQSKNLD